MSKCGMTRGQSQLVAALLCPSLIEQVCSAGWHVDKAVATFSLSSLGLLCPTSTATSNKLCPTSWIGRQKWEEGKKLLWEIYSHLRTPGFNAKVELLLLLYNMQTHLTHYRLVYLIFGMMYLVFGVVYLTFGQTLWLSKRWRKVMQKKRVNRNKSKVATKVRNALDNLICEREKSTKYQLSFEGVYIFLGESLTKVHSSHPGAARKPRYFNGKGALDIPIPIALSNFQIIRFPIDAIVESSLQKDKSKK